MEIRKIEIKYLVREQNLVIGQINKTLSEKLQNQSLKSRLSERDQKREIKTG